MTIGNHYRIIGIPACVQNGLQATACIEVTSVQLYKPNGKKVPFKINFKKPWKPPRKKSWELVVFYYLEIQITKPLRDFPFTVWNEYLLVFENICFCPLSMHWETPQLFTVVLQLLFPSSPIHWKVLWNHIKWTWYFSLVFLSYSISSSRSCLPRL